MSVSLKIAGSDLTQTPYLFDVLEVRKPLMGEPKSSATEYGVEHGEYRSGGALAGLTFDVTLATMASTSEAKEARLDALRALLDTRNDQKFECSLWSDRFWYARLEGLVEEEPIGLNGCELRMKFRAPDPVAYGATEVSNDYEIDSDDKMIVVPSTDLAHGSEVARPVITVTCATNETLFKFYSQTMDQTLLYVFYAYAGYKVQFDSQQYLIRYSADGGMTWTPRMQGKTGTFLTLKPGVNNSIRVEHLNGTSLNVKFRERYV